MESVLGSVGTSSMTEGLKVLVGVGDGASRPGTRGGSMGDGVRRHALGWLCASTSMAELRLQSATSSRIWARSRSRT